MLASIPERLKKLYHVEKVESNDLIINIPSKSVIPYILHSEGAYIKKFIAEENIEFVKPVEETFPKPPNPDL